MEWHAVCSSLMDPATQDLDELLMGSDPMDAMPLELSNCDFGFDEKALDFQHVVAQSRGSNVNHAVAMPTASSFFSSSPSPAVALAPAMMTPPVKKSDRRSVTKRKGDVILPSSCLGDGHEDNYLANPQQATQVGRWTKKEHELFLEGLRLYGKSWKKISSLVNTRTLVQIRTHAQKYLQKQTKAAQKAHLAQAAAGPWSGYHVVDKAMLSRVASTPSLYCSPTIHPLLYPSLDSSNQHNLKQLDSPNQQQPGDAFVHDYLHAERRSDNQWSAFQQDACGHESTDSSSLMGCQQSSAFNLISKRRRDPLDSNHFCPEDDPSFIGWQASSNQELRTPTMTTMPVLPTSMSQNANDNTPDCPTWTADCSGLDSLM